MFDHAAAAAQIALGIAYIGEQWALGALTGISGVFERKERPDGLGGTAFDLEISFVRSTLGEILPPEGTAVTNSRTGESYRLVTFRAGSPGTIVAVVTSALR
jgi:hypothetical protein